MNHERAEGHPENTGSPNTGGGGFGKFGGHRQRWANAVAREEKGFVVVEALALQFGKAIAQMRFEFAQVGGSEAGVAGEFGAPLGNSVI